MNCYLPSLTLLALLATTSANALVLATDPTGNTTAPTGTNGQPTDPGFANIGAVNGSSGVYLGNGWVLTARHVGAGNFSTGGVTYNYDGTSAFSIAGTDLTVFKLSSNPVGLSSLTIASSAPGVGAEVVMIGNGRTATSSNSTQYYVDTTVVDGNGDPDWVWSTTPFANANAQVSGYATYSTRGVRWGTNTITDFGLNANGIGYYYYTTFDGVGSNAYEAQAVTHDSGGAVFYLDGDDWHLAGIMVAVGLFPNQPGGATSAVEGNVTYIVDLSKYADEINALIPEPSTYALLGAVAIFGVTALARRRRQQR